MVQAEEVGRVQSETWMDPLGRVRDHQSCQIPYQIPLGPEVVVEHRDKVR
jgi:hypothetical protein